MELFNAPVNDPLFDSVQRLRPAIQADDVPLCRQLAEQEAPLWVGSSPITSLDEMVASLAIDANSLRLLQHQLQLPEGAAEAAAAYHLPCSGQEPPAASAAADPLLLQRRDPAELGRLLALHARLPAQEPAALMLVAAGAEPSWSLVFRAVEKRMPRLLEVVLPMMPPWEEPPMPPNQVLRVPCGGFRRWPYNESAPLLLLGAHQEQGRHPLDLTSLRLAEALGAAGMQPPVYNDVRVAREVRLPRLVPRKTRMNLRLGHEQQAEMVAEFNPGLEDPYFGARDRCRYLWLAMHQQPWWSPDTHFAWPASFREAARALLLASQRLAAPGAVAVVGSTSQGSQQQQGPSGPAAANAVTLGSLPTGVLLHILGMAAHPLSAWIAGLPA